MELQDKVAYIIAVVSEFADVHGLKTNQAFRYLFRFDGIGFVDRHYEVEHTLPFDDVIDDLTAYCHRKGGMLQ